MKAEWFTEWGHVRLSADGLLCVSDVCQNTRTGRAAMQKALSGRMVMGRIGPRPTWFASKHDITEAFDHIGGPKCCPVPCRFFSMMSMAVMLGYHSDVALNKALVKAGIFKGPVVVPRLSQVSSLADEYADCGYLVYHCGHRTDYMRGARWTRSGREFLLYLRRQNIV